MTQPNKFNLLLSSFRRCHFWIEHWTKCLSFPYGIILLRCLMQFQFIAFKEISYVNNVWCRIELWKWRLCFNECMTLCDPENSIDAVWMTFFTAVKFSSKCVRRSFVLGIKPTAETRSLSLINHTCLFTHNPWLRQRWNAKRKRVSHTRSVSGFSGISHWTACGRWRCDGHSDSS